MQLAYNRKYVTITNNESDIEYSNNYHHNPLTRRVVM